MFTDMQPVLPAGQRIVPAAGSDRPRRAVDLYTHRLLDVG